MCIIVVLHSQASAKVQPSLTTLSVLSVKELSEKNEINILQSVV